MRQKFRIKILSKLAQTTPSDPSANTATDSIAKNETVSGSPQTFNALDLYPSISAFQSKNIPWINSLSQLLNLTIFYLSQGKSSLIWMKNNNFNVGTDQVPSVNLRNIFNFSKQVYQNIFTNNGQAYKTPLNPQQIDQKIKSLISSQFLNNLSSNISQQLTSSIGGDLKTKIIDILRQIK